MQLACAFGLSFVFVDDVDIAIAVHSPGVWRVASGVIIIANMADIYPHLK